MRLSYGWQAFNADEFSNFDTDASQTLGIIIVDWQQTLWTSTGSDLQCSLNCRWAFPSISIFRFFQRVNRSWKSVGLAATFPQATFYGISLNGRSPLGQSRSFIKHQLEQVRLRHLGRLFRRYRSCRIREDADRGVRFVRGCFGSPDPSISNIL